MVVIGDWLFRRQDLAARAAGWEIRRTHGGLGRRYRDPRIARRARALVPPPDEAERLRVRVHVRRPVGSGVGGGR